MPTHPDALEYLHDLANEIDKPWFEMICDLACVSGGPVPDQPTLDVLRALYTGRASYIGIKAGASSGAAPMPAVPADSLERLSHFTDFKLLGATLEVHFKKRITLIFGANGSGKSSLCESLKVLASPAYPSRPLENVRAAGAANPTFSYKFKSDSAQQTWTPSAGYGPRSATIKYFDTTIAIRNVTNAVEPGRVIVLTPFKLHIFDKAKGLTTTLRCALQKSHHDNLEKLTQSLAVIRTDFSRFKARPLATIENKTVSTLSAQIKLGEEFTDQELLGEKQAAANELEKAASEGGLKLLQAEHHQLEYFLTSVTTLLTSAAELWALEPVSKAKILAEKQAAQEVLARALIPKKGTLDDLLAILRAASPICKMDEAAGHTCPLCRRDLGIPEVELFKQYHGLLDGELEKHIATIKTDITKARESATAVGQVDRKAWDKCKTIEETILAEAKTCSDLIVASCDISKEPTPEARMALESLKASAKTWATQLESKMTAIGTAAKGRDELLKQLAKLQAEIEPLEYAQAIAHYLVKLKEAQRMEEHSLFWDANLPTFTHVLKRITEKAKEAHDELVVADFEMRLDAEYKALAEKNMAAFGVMLARKGTYAAVTVLPHIGGKNIEEVLSEGEQRVHALALFFAELETCQHSVLVFDDPISSFDYNYTANYCSRLRDFAKSNPERQIIVLTHSWDFFVQVQQTLNKAQLNNHLTVQVLEGCTQLAEYSEEIDTLKAEIDAILALSTEPTRKQKDDVAGNLRRLMEAMVNTYAFNNQRHQFKQKTYTVSQFQHYTKLVALLPEEAAILRDLYERLSPPEHGGDARNSYVNTDKAMFQTRYNKILAVETAVKARVP